MKIEQITSSENPKIKLIRQLYNSKGRRKYGLFIAEGIREISMAYKSDFKIKYLFINELFLQKKDISTFPFSHQIFYQLDTKLFSKISYREDTEGIIGIFETKKHTLSEIHLSTNPYVIILESVEKPGNLGAVLRTADAVKADAVLVCNPVIDIYNPNVIRSSIGCIFVVPVAVCNNTEALNWLREHRFTIYAAALQDAIYYHQSDFTSPTAIAFGTEAEGLTDFWRKEADYIIKIPMLGKIDSLNVSNSVAILSYEVLRQRNFYLTD